MTKRPARPWLWAAGLVSALLVSQSAGLANAPAAPAHPPGPGFGRMGLQSADQHFIVMMIEVGAFYWTVLAPDIVNSGRVEQDSASV